MIAQKLADKSRSRWHYALVIVVTSVLMLWQLGATALDGHEAFVASTARNMADSQSWLNPDIVEGPLPPNTPANHWLIPVFNGSPRLVKTPLAYWCVAGLLELGLPDNEFTARLPSALASIVLAVVVLALGRSMFSTRAALLGALMLSTSLAYVSWGRNGRVDMQMTLWMSLAMACVFWALNQPSARKRHLLLLAAWGCLGLGNLAKEMVPLFLLLPIGLYLCWRASAAFLDDDAARRAMIRYLLIAAAGFLTYILIRVAPFLQWWRAVNVSEGAGMYITIAVMICGPAAWYAMRSKVWRQANAVLPTLLPGAVLMLALFVPWLMYIAGIFPKANHIFETQTAGRALGAGRWVDSSALSFAWYYLACLAKWSLPWIILLPGALAMPILKRFKEDRNALVFLMLWVFGLVLLFSVSVGKHGQYIIPAMPAACLLMSFCAEDLFFGHRWFSPRMARNIVVGYGLTILVATAGAVVALAVVKPERRPLVVHVLVIAGLAVVPSLAAMAWVRSRPAVAIASMVTAVLLAEIGFATLTNPWDTRWENYAILGRRILNEVPADDRVLALEPPDPTLVWYGRDLPVASQAEARLVKTHGKDKGNPLWQQWLSQGRPVWVIASDKKARETKALSLSQVGNLVSIDGQNLGLFRCVSIAGGIDETDDNNLPDPATIDP